jgi:PAS domain S-box-containing protein
LEGIIAHVADALFVVEPGGWIIDANPAACALLGYAKPEVLGFSLWDFISAASREESRSSLANMRFETTAILQRMCRGKAGVIKQIDLRLTRCRLANRDQIIVVCRDVTEQKLLADRLRQSERHLAEGQRLTRTGSWVLDFLTGETDWSVETCRIFGFPDPPPSPHYREFQARVRSEDRDAVDRGLRKSFETGEPQPLEYDFVLPNGVRKRIETISQPVRDESGAIVKLMGTVMDVTERKQAEAAIRAAKSRFEGILEIAEDAIISVDARQRIGLFNQGAETVFGYAAAEVIGQPLELLLPARFAFAHQGQVEAFARAPEISRSMAERREVFGRRKDGREFPAEASISKLDLGEEVVFTVILRDITERKQAAEALRASEKFARGQAEALARTLDALVRESEPERIVEPVLRTITQQLEAHSSSVWLMDETNGLMVFEFALDAGGFKTKADAGRVAISTAQKNDAVWPWPEVFRTGRPSVLADIRKGPDFPWRNQVLAQGVVCILIVPMLIAGEVRGVIGIRFAQARAFRPEEMELAQALAHQAMLATQLARLLAQNRRSAALAERNRLARDMHDTLAQGFTGVIVQLEAAAAADSKGLANEAKVHLCRAGELARESLKEAPRSVRALRPRALEGKNLSEALKDLAQKRMALKPVPKLSCLRRRAQITVAY